MLQQYKVLPVSGPIIWDRHEPFYTATATVSNNHNILYLKEVKFSFTTPVLEMGGKLKKMEKSFGAYQIRRSRPKLLIELKHVTIIMVGNIRT